MRILYCTDIILNRHRVPTIHIDAIASALVERGHSVAVVVPRIDDFEQTGGYHVQIVHSPRVLLSIVYQLQLFAVLCMNIARERPDIIYVRHSHLLIVPTLIGKLFRIPVVLEINGILEQDAKYLTHTWRSRVLLTSGIFSFLERLNARLAEHSIAVTEGIREYFHSHYRVPLERITVIHNGVDTKRFSPSTARTAPLVVGYVGSLHEWQGVAYILEAASLLRDTEIRFVIIGSGEEGERLHAIARERGLTNVEFRGAIAHEDVPGAMRSFDIAICYPLKFRDGATSPFKVYEYLASGNAVVAADLPGIRAEFGDALTYVAAENGASLAGAIRDLANDHGRRQVFQKKGRAKAEASSWESVARETERVFREAIR